jgi:uroporphyrinogen III methyltransferase/synthase
MASSSPQSGIVYLIGAGPGDPGLITVRGLERLRQADVVVYDRLANHSLLAHAGNAELIDVGKRPDRHPVPQEDINALLVEQAQAGKVVARLKGGDPFVFGRGGEEALALMQAGLPFEIIPGITSAIAGPAYAGVPVTHRGVAYSFTVITGHRANDVNDPNYDWNHLANGPDTLIFLMGVSNLAFIAEQLIAHGRSPDTPVALVERASRTAQQTVVGTLSNITERATEIRPPAIIIIGEVVRLREELRWFDRSERHPLLGLRVLNTRPLDQAGEFSRRLMDLGAEVVELPTTQIVPVTDTGPLDAAIDQLVYPAPGQAQSGWDWIIFASANSVAYFIDRLLGLGHDVRMLRGVELVVLGQATAKALRQYGLVADFTPTRHTSRDLVTELGNVAGQRILIPRSNIPFSGLTEALRSRGAVVEAVTAYAVMSVEPDPVAVSIG